MAKHLVQLIFAGAQVVGKAFAKALRQEIAASQAAAERAGGGARGAEHSATNQRLGMTIEEAKQILNVEELDIERINKNYDYLFNINDKSKGGTFYLQSKIQRDCSSSLSREGIMGVASLGLETAVGRPSFNGTKRWYSSSSGTKEFDVTWDTVLSKENRARCMKSVSALPSLRRSKKKVHNYSAVLVPLCYVEGELSMLYTLRTSDLRTHRREVSFPGGKADPSDESLVHTALRETEEEIGFGAQKVDVWGSFPPQPGKDGDSSVVSVLGYIGHVDAESFVLNPREVEVVFAVTLKNLCDPRNCRQTQFRSEHYKNGYTLPIFIGSDPKVWGLTAIVTHLTLSALLPEIYSHRIYHTSF